MQAANGKLGEDNLEKWPVTIHAPTNALAVLSCGNQKQFLHRVQTSELCKWPWLKVCPRYTQDIPTK
jgi:hypothetical protein